MLNHCILICSIILFTCLLLHLKSFNPFWLRFLVYLCTHLCNANFPVCWSPFGYFIDHFFEQLLPNFCIHRVAKIVAKLDLLANICIDTGSSSSYCCILRWSLQHTQEGRTFHKCRPETWPPPKVPPLLLKRESSFEICAA